MTGLRTLEVVGTCNCLKVAPNTPVATTHASRKKRACTRMCAKHKMTNDEHGGPIQHKPCSIIDIRRFIHSRRPELIRQLCSSEQLTSRPTPSNPEDNGACVRFPVPRQNSTKWWCLTCGKNLIAKALWQTRASFLSNCPTPFKIGYKVSRRHGQIRQGTLTPLHTCPCWAGPKPQVRISEHSTTTL